VQRLIEEEGKFYINGGKGAVVGVLENVKGEGRIYFTQSAD
jgi:hypothetical protein